MASSLSLSVSFLIIFLILFNEINENLSMRNHHPISNVMQHITKERRRNDSITTLVNSDYIDRISFYVYNKQGEPNLYQSNNLFVEHSTESIRLEDEHPTASSASSTSSAPEIIDECNNPEGKFAIIVHGWRESCDTKWVLQLVQKLNSIRGGCILCMDYRSYSYDVFVRLVRHFDSIAQILTNNLMELEDKGFLMSNGYLFGFSFGGQLVTEAGRRIGFKRIQEIDTCDMAGPGFDHRPPVDHRLAAVNVQCLHTSRDKGTRYYTNCHQNWRLGNCGYTQNAAGEPPLGSHGLCPYIYLSAFDNDFYAIDKPKVCTTKISVIQWPEKFKMGYMENRTSQVQGELFALTSDRYPYNVLENGDLDTNSSNEIEQTINLTSELVGISSGNVQRNNVSNNSTTEEAHVEDSQTL